MPWWVSLVGLALKALGFLGWAKALFDRYEAKQEGKKEQRQADLEATVKEANDANKNADDVSHLTHDQLVDELHNNSTRH